MASVNKVILVGNVGQDPEIRVMPSGDSVANFSLATSEKWKTKEGEQRENTEWHRVEVFGPVAKVIESYVTKGKQIYVEGSLRTDEWEDKEGNKRKTTKIRVAGPNSRVVLLGAAGNGDSDDYQRSSAKQRREPARSKSDDSDLPF